MRNKLLGSLILMICYALTSSAQSLAPGKIKTRWAKNVNASNVWQKYPRPQMVRSQWMNLNGLWDYAIIKKDNAEPKKYDGKILVPFCAESSLSGVEKSVLPDENLWYKRSFNIPTSWKGKKILLHFDAVDWETKVWLNGKLIGQHQGGSDPFTFDVSKYLKNGAQELTVSVWDPTDTGTQPRGKQQLSQKGIWYTPVTGIWQTVWLEPVESAYIERITPIADIDQNKVRLKNLINGAKGNESLSIKVMSNNKVIADQSFKVNSPIEITVPNPELWSPDHPFLYQLNVQLKRGNKVLDQIGSYFAMRKISIGKDKYGYERLLLNNEPKFQYGTLDQGWWPDGLLTPPSEEAMLYDMQILKDMGFNMLRKHIKVEPSRYYHDADSLGILIWQDMVTGFKTSEKATQHVQSGAKEDWQRPKNSADEFENEWKAIIDHLSFFPSIVTWVTFNEGWGQYDTKRIVEWTQKYDPSRVIDGVSGWEDRGVGNMIDTHQYPGPGMELASLNPGRVVVLGEFGGLGLPIQNHLWNPEMRNWGYRTYKSGKELVKEYAELIHNMYPMINRGLSAAVYTQTTDVEGEVNGLMTYDRDSIKIDLYLMRILNNQLYHPIQASETIFENSEIKPQDFLVSKQSNPYQKDGLTINREKFSLFKGPVNMKKDGNKWLLKQFDLAKVPEMLQLRISGSGDIKIYLNGKKVTDKFLNAKRSYDEINLSEYINYLKPGENDLLIEIKNILPQNPTLDLGLYSSK